LFFTFEIFRNCQKDQILLEIDPGGNNDLWPVIYVWTLIYDQFLCTFQTWYPCELEVSFLMVWKVFFHIFWPPSSPPHINPWSLNTWDMLIYDGNSNYCVPVDVDDVDVLLMLMLLIILMTLRMLLVMLLWRGSGGMLGGIMSYTLHTTHQSLYTISGGSEDEGRAACWVGEKYKKYTYITQYTLHTTHTKHTLKSLTAQQVRTAQEAPREAATPRDLSN
jgi:hypothetical protein